MGCGCVELHVLDTSVVPRWCIKCGGELPNMWCMSVEVCHRCTTDNEYEIITRIYNMLCYLDIEYYVPVNTCMEVGAWRCAKYSLDI